MTQATDPAPNLPAAPSTGLPAAVLCRLEGDTLRLTLQRPAARNALDAATVAALLAALSPWPVAARRLVLDGAGAVFCAGADLDWMVPAPRSPAGGRQAPAAGPAAGVAAALAADEAGAPARQLAALFAALDAVPAVVMARAHGAAMGGGVGLLACCDLVVAEAGCRFALSEVRLGLLPALIAPYVRAKIGPSASRRLFTTAADFDAEEAQRLGLVHHVAASEAAAVAQMEGPWAAAVSRAAPGAVAQSKLLLRELATLPGASEPAHLIAHLSRRLASAEAHEGTAAFRQRRRPAWATRHGGQT